MYVCWYVLHFNNDNPRNSFQVAAGWQAGSPAAGRWQGWPAAVMSARYKKNLDKEAETAEKPTTITHSHLHEYFISLFHALSQPLSHHSLTRMYLVIHSDYEILILMLNNPLPR